MNAAKNAQGTLEERAVTLGREAGVNAAEWWLQESPIGGRSSAGPTEARVWAADVLERMNDGDPAVYDSFPVVDLSGEWADGWTPKRLAEELGMDEDAEDGDDLDSLCDAFEEGVHAGVSETIEAALIEAAQGLSALGAADMASGCGLFAAIGAGNKATRAAQAVKS